MQTKEIWKPIRERDGYEVSSHGNVRRAETGKLIRPYKTTNGYWRIGLGRIDGTIPKFQVHRLVASAFLGIRPDGLEVNHKNGNKTDNQLDNLEYISPVDNVRHAVLIGRPVGKRGKDKSQNSRKKTITQ